MKSIQPLEHGIVIKDETIDIGYAPKNMEPFPIQCQDQQMATVKAELDTASPTQGVDEVSVKDEMEIGPHELLPQHRAPGFITMADSKEERLLKKRLTERRRKARIKNDPELYALHKERDRQRYYKKKEEGVIKPLSELNPHQQKTLRERSRISSNKYNLKKRREACLKEDLIHAPIISCDTDDPLQEPQLQTKRFRTNQENDLSPMPRLSANLSIRRLRSYQKSPAPLSPSSGSSVVSRSKDAFTSQPSTPKTKKLNPKDTIRRLKYRMNKMYALQKAKIDKLKVINERYRRQIYRLKKQKAESDKSKTDTAKVIVPQHALSESESISKMKNDIELFIKTFLEDDENSRMCSGKKECITKKKIKKQKYLNNSLKELYIRVYIKFK